MPQSTCTRVQPLDGCVPGVLAPLRPLSEGVRNACYSMRSSCYSMSSTARRLRGATHCMRLLACCSAVLQSATWFSAQGLAEGRSGGGASPVSRARRALRERLGRPRWCGRDFTTAIPRRGDVPCSRPGRGARQSERTCRSRRVQKRALLHGAIRQRRLRWLLVRNQPLHAASLLNGQESEEPPIRERRVATSCTSGVNGS